MDDAALLSDVTRFRSDVQDVATKRDLWTATERGAQLNRIISKLDRNADDLSARQKVLLELVHSHARDMMNCPRRMRLDSTWQDDFVVAAQKAADAIITLVTIAPE